MLKINYKVGDSILMKEEYLLLPENYHPDMWIEEMEITLLDDEHVELSGTKRYVRTNSWVLDNA